MQKPIPLARRSKPAMTPAHHAALWGGGELDNMMRKMVLTVEVKTPLIGLTGSDFNLPDKHPFNLFLT